MRDDDSKNRTARNGCGALRSRHRYISGFSALAEEIMVERGLLSRVCEHTDRHYCRYYIKDKRGKFRKIEEPDYYMTIIQDRIRKSFLNRYPVSGYATAYHAGARITANAAPHVGRKYLLKMDLKEFCPRARPLRPRCRTWS